MAYDMAVTLKRPMMFSLPMTGWKEYVRFPKLRLGPIIAKIDTGARTAALHADIIEVTGRRVRFVIVDDEGRKRSYRAPLVGHRRVKSSNGVSELRAVIRATLELGGKSIKAEVTLTDRTDMGVPMLLGRATIKGHFIVNPAKTFLLSRKRKQAT
jgi:hypothetical protein